MAVISRHREGSTTGQPFFPFVHFSPSVCTSNWHTSPNLPLPMNIWHTSQNKNIVALQLIGLSAHSLLHLCHDCPIFAFLLRQAHVISGATSRLTGRRSWAKARQCISYHHGSPWLPSTLTSMLHTRSNTYNGVNYIDRSTTFTIKTHKKTRIKPSTLLSISFRFTFLNLFKTFLLSGLQYVGANRQYTDRLTNLTFMRPTMVIHKPLALVITVTQSMGSKPRQIFLFTSSETIFLLQPNIVSHNHFSTLLSHLTQNQLTSFTYLTQKSHFLNFTFTILTFNLTISTTFILNSLRARPKAERVFAEYENFLKLSDPTDRP